MTTFKTKIIIGLLTLGFILSFLGNYFLFSRIMYLENLVQIQEIEREEVNYNPIQTVFTDCEKLIKDFNTHRKVYNDNPELAGEVESCVTLVNTLFDKD